jgi:C4-dicarboxylate-specific signal transduction histidine kinase
MVHLPNLNKIADSMLGALPSVSAGDSGGGRLRSLRQVMLRRVVLIALLQVVLGIVVAKWQLYPQLEKLQGELNATLAHNIANSTKNALQKTLVSVGAALRPLNDARVQQSGLQQLLIGQLIDGNESAESSYIIDAKGKVTAVAIARTGSAGSGPAEAGDRMGLDLSQSALFKSPLRESVTISPIYLSAVSDQPMVAVTGPLTGKGLLVLEISLTRLTQDQKEKSTTDDVLVLIVDGKGQIVADTSGARARRSAMLEVEALRTVQSRGAALISFDDMPWMASASDISIGNLDWHVVVMRPQDKVYGPITSIVLLSTLSTGVLLTLTILVLFLVSRKVAKATEVLSQNARELEAGHVPQLRDLAVRELADVDKSLRSMAATLTQRESQLRSTNEQLELRVQERTHHLQTVNADLEQTMKRLEATQSELVQAGKMAALGGMVAGISHELNTPVGNAKLAASALVENARRLQEIVDSGKVSKSEIQRCTAAFEEGANLIDRSLERASDIVRSFKQVAVDQTSNRRRNFELGEVIRENYILLSPRLNKAGISVNMELPSKFEMNGYPGVIGQVLTNLLENAMLHGYSDSQGGQVDIVAQAVSQDVVRLTVRDYGRGIANEALSKVFDPFYTTRMGQGGSGLGLSIVYSLITHSLAGKISVDSKVGSGTSFILELPMNSPETQGVAPAV